MVGICSDLYTNKQIFSGSDLFFDPSVFEPLIVTVKWLLDNNKVLFPLLLRDGQFLCVTNASGIISCFCSRGVSFSAQFRSEAQTGPLNSCSRNINYPAGCLTSHTFNIIMSFVSVTSTPLTSLLALAYKSLISQETTQFSSLGSLKAVDNKLFDRTSDREVIQGNL